MVDIDSIITYDPDLLWNSDIYNPRPRYKEVLVSGKPLAINSITNSYGRFNDSPDIMINVHKDGTPEITLSDSTHINFRHSALYYKLCHSENETWSFVEDYEGSPYYFLAKLPGEDEYQKFSSITFKKDWGEFISGELHADK